MYAEHMLSRVYVTIAATETQQYAPFYITYALDLSSLYEQFVGH